MFCGRATLSLYLPRALCDCTRNVRMGVSIPIKKVKPVVQPKRTETYSKEEFAKVRRGNRGIAHGLIRRVESGYDQDDHEDPDDFFNTDLDAFDSKYILDEHKKLAEKDLRTKHYYNVKRKYFKEEKLPNMVTYLEKQQIKCLHKEDPEHWNIYQLAESFPASPSIIKKILQSTFTAYTVENVQKHDKVVRKNWDLFRKGKLQFDEELRAHYAKFGDRQNFETNVNEIKKYLPPPPDFNDQPIREFSNIISSSKKYKALHDERRKAETDEDGKTIHTSKNMEMRLINEDLIFKSDWNHLTLKKLREKIESNCRFPVDALITKQDPKKSIPPSSSVVEGSIDTLNESDNMNLGPKTVENQSSEVKDFKYENPETGASRKRMQKRTRPPSTPETEESRDIYKAFDYLNKETGVVDKKLPYNFVDQKLDEVRLRIHIPQKVWQKDKLYRIKDCFYDDQGIFLYRVPGLF